MALCSSSLIWVARIRKGQPEHSKLGRVRQSISRGGRYHSLMATQGGTHYLPGDAAVLRYLEHGGGIAAAGAWRVVEDSDSQLLLYIPAGTSFMYAPWVRVNGRIDTGQPRSLAGAEWRGRDVLRMMYPDTPYSIWLLWDMPQRSLIGWYVNLEAPFARTEIGFDTQDHELDVVVRPDFSWYWKDEDDLRDLVAAGVFSDEKAALIRGAGEDAIRRLERRDPPFNEPWPEWRPDPEWGSLELPDGWDDVPGALLPD